MKIIKKILSIFAIIFLVFCQIAFIIPPAIAEAASVRSIPTKDQIKKNSKNYVEGQVLVKFKEDKINLKQLDNTSKVKQFAKDKNLDFKETIGKSNMAILKTKRESVESAINRLKNDPSVQYAEPNYIRKPSTISTNDTFKDKLWGLDNTGQTINRTTGKDNADINMPEAWNITEGSNNVVVAIIDTGVDYNHPDLQSSMWDGTNCKDENGVALNNCNHGYDFEDNDKTPLPIHYAHGTHVAGTIAAAKNNNKGVVGVAPKVKIMAIKFGFDTVSEIKAIDFAIQNGAKVINASYGGYYFSQSEYDAINRFKTAGGIFVAAAGNGGSNNDDADTGYHSYPSDYNLDNIISVAATDQNDNLASFSSYGVTSVDIAAPGVNIYSTVADLQYFSTLFEPFTSTIVPAIPNGWTKTGNWGTYDTEDSGLWGKVLYGDLALPYTSNANSTITSAKYDLSGASSVDLGFITVCDTEYITGRSWEDYMALEISGDGTNFTEVSRWDEAEMDYDKIESNNYNGSTGSYIFEAIPSNLFTDNFKFRFRWVTDSDNNKGTTGNGCLVDDVFIDKYSLGSAELYQFYNGTSMATPHAVGLAALIWSKNLSLTSSQVKSIILNSGDSKTSLTGKIVSGKRINAYNALLTANGPAITGLPNDTNPTKSKTWNWSSTDPTAQFRFLIDQSANTAPSGSYSGTVTATQSSGNGTYYIHVQAKNSSEIESSVITVSAVLDSTAPTGKVPPCGSYGDVNGDGFVTKADADMISNYLVGNITLTSQQKLLADVNASNTVTISDAMFIAQYIAGTRSTFPVCPTPTSTPTSMPTPTPTTTPQPTPTAIPAATPLTINASVSKDKILTTWSGISSPTATDWIGIYPENATDGAYSDWIYINSCTRTAGASTLNSGSCEMNLPATNGNYQIRMFANNQLLQKLATSPTFSY